ncbi:MAG TPA: hypothetical protein VI953_04395 [Candidatus Paceibacterota bacterium]
MKEDASAFPLPKPSTEPIPIRVGEREELEQRISRDTKKQFDAYRKLSPEALAAREKDFETTDEGVANDAQALIRGNRGKERAVLVTQTGIDAIDRELTEEKNPEMIKLLNAAKTYRQRLVIACEASI